MSKEKKRVLGRGLSALLSENAETVQTAQDKGAEQLVGNIVEISIHKIIPNPNQPRSNFDAKTLEELAQSIKELGVIQPITVRKVGSNFELISGERRYRASQLAGLSSIPAYVRLANDQEMLEMALVENIQREDLDAIEIALTYQRLIDEINLTQEELSKRVGKERSTVTNYMRLLKLDPIIQTGIRDGIISMGHGRALLSVDNSDTQFDVYEEIIRKNLSVRQTENRIQQLKNPPAAKPVIAVNNEMKKTANHWAKKWETAVEVKKTAGGKGKIIISFDSDEEFERLKNLLD